MQVAGTVFGVDALSSRYFCPWGSSDGIFPCSEHSAGAPGNEGSRLIMKESCLSLSWCPLGEPGSGVGAAVGFMGWGWWGHVFALDVVLVTCKL